MNKLSRQPRKNVFFVAITFDGARSMIQLAVASFSHPGRFEACMTRAFVELRLREVEEFMNANAAPAASPLLVALNSNQPVSDRAGICHCARRRQTCLAPQESDAAIPAAATSSMGIAVAHALAIRN